MTRSEHDSTAEVAADAAPFDPLDPEHYRDPRERLANARGGCPVSEPRHNLHFVARDEDARNVLRAPDAFSSAGNFWLEADTDGDYLVGADPDSLNPPGQDPFVTNSDPPLHTAIRRMMLTWLDPAKIQARDDEVRRVVDEVLDQLPTDEPVDVMTTIAADVPGRVVYGLIGLPDEQREQVLELSNTINQLIPDAFGCPELDRLGDAVGGLIAARRQADTPEDTIVDGLLGTERDGRQLSDADVWTHLTQLFLAGTETTASLMGNVLYELLSERGRWERLLADRSLVPAAIEESLRHDAPLQWALRLVRDDETIAGTEVRQGSRVLVGLQSANLDEDRWGADAAEYSLDREQSQKHLSFGFGAHRCLGAPLARLETVVLLERLLERFPEVALAPGFQREPGIGVMNRRPARLDIVLKPGS